MTYDIDIKSSKWWRRKTYAATALPAIYDLAEVLLDLREGVRREKRHAQRRLSMLPVCAVRFRRSALYFIGRLPQRIAASSSWLDGSDHNCLFVPLVQLSAFLVRVLVMMIVRDTSSNKPVLATAFRVPTAGTR